MGLAHEPIKWGSLRLTLKYNMRGLEHCKKDIEMLPDPNAIQSASCALIHKLWRTRNKLRIYRKELRSEFEALEFQECVSAGGLTFRQSMVILIKI